MELSTCDQSTESVCSPCEDLSIIPVKQLKGTRLEWSTVCKEGYNCRGTKSCLFCGHLYAGGPDRTRYHLGLSRGSQKHMKLCNPSKVWQNRHLEVVAELKARLQQEQLQLQNKASKEVAVKSVNNLDIRCALKMCPKAEEVNEAWAKVIAAKGLPIDFVDDPFVRAAITMTARASTVYIDAKDADCKLPHRTIMATKILPALDKKLNEDIESKMSGLLKQTGAMIISDGWTSVQSRPIINALLTTPAGTMFLKALDTSGNVKDAEFIADFICAIIEARGPKNIVAVCMDGACTASFPLIEDKYPHVFCFICPTHALDNFMKNVFSDKEKIKMKSIVGEFDWDSKHLSYHFRRPPNLDCWRPTTTIL